LSPLDLNRQQSTLSAVADTHDEDHQLKPGKISMNNKHVDQGKGRLKEAAGSLTGDNHLKNEGRRDQAKGSAKEAVDKVVDTLPGRGTE
jgi:uncharacterized protein YjbJ (UPF0337 family)